jgi:hypothetical protein
VFLAGSKDTVRGALAHTEIFGELGDAPFRMVGREAAQ